jgi:hypothetical protein
MVGLAVVPAKRRVEILAVTLEFAGLTGLPATGEGNLVAALTTNGLVHGSRCREIPPQRPPPLARDNVGPWRETTRIWFHCGGLYDEVRIFATRNNGGGHTVSIGRDNITRVRASLLPKRQGQMFYSLRTCSHFYVTGNPIP